jgi:S1-C subfamily serine protease
VSEDGVFGEVTERDVPKNGNVFIEALSDQSFRGVSPQMEFKGIENGQVSVTSFTVNGISMKPNFQGPEQTMACRNFLERNNVISQGGEKRYSLIGYFVGSESLGVKKSTSQKHHANFVDIKWVLSDNDLKSVVYEKVFTGGSYAGTLNFNKREEAKEQNLFSSRNAIVNSLKRLLSDPAFKESFQKESHSNKEEGSTDLIVLNQNQNRCKDLTGCTEATVSIQTSDGHGSGFFIDSRGYLFTNAHVVKGDSLPLVILSSGISVPAKVIRFDSQTDVALLKVDIMGMTVIGLSTSVKAEIGSDVFAIGTPKDLMLGQTITKGVISALRTDPQEVIQTDVSINAGNSGGPLLNANHEVIGIVTSKLVGFGTEGIGFAIPVVRALNALTISLGD